ncbi:succinylglutamate desuccinylase/aspartoacylase family protein [Falsiruegeria litorea]|nr:succinylglutamate desuccinylase/aspartoacylase family protein [Falsiruegeria litorea]
MAETLISSEVDLDAMGKHAGFLRVPHSVHDSAYGWIPVPIASIRNGAGPVVLLLAGVHGDEYEGQIALSKLVRSLAPDQITGQIIVLTMANFPAAEAGLRTSPIDGGNLNRVFPGDPTGTPTQMIADYIERYLLPRCDYLIDLHSGGTSLFYPPTLLRGQGYTQQEAVMLKAIQDAFDLPYAWVFTGGGGPNSTARTAMGAGNRNGVVSVMAELGGAGAVTPSILAQTERGLRRVLHRLALLSGAGPVPQNKTREMHALGTICIYDRGVFEPVKDIGDDISEGEVSGYVLRLDRPLEAPTEVISSFTGTILCKRPLGQVKCGDVVYQVAADTT